MNEPSGSEKAEEATRAAVARVVQRMVAARLGRGFVTLGVVFLFGALEMALRGPLESDYTVLVTGSVVAGGAMLVYGNGAVRRALGREGKGLGRVTAALGLLPYAFALYLLGFRGLRPLAAGAAPEGGGVAIVVALVFVLLGAKMLWDLTRLTRLHGFARTMTVPAPGEHR